MTKKKLYPNNLKKAALVSALLLELAGTAAAATITVDGTTCTFPDAITAANTDAVVGGCTAGAGADELDLASGLTITLTAGLTEIRSDVTINGNGSTLDCASTVRGFIISGGSATFNLNDTTVTNCVTSPGNYGAGARSYAGSTMNINNSIFTGNVGGAIVFTDSSGTVNDSTIDGNFTNPEPYYSAGISVIASNVTVSNSSITNNVTTSTGAGGGGFYVGSYGGASELNIINSTITGNSSVQRGGGIAHFDYGVPSTINLTNVTLVDNTSDASGGGISNDTANFTISQSLISGNTNPVPGGAEIDSTGGTVTVDDFNMIGVNGVANVGGVTIGASDIVPTESLTDIVDTTLADNGGPTLTHALPMGSPAIDAVPAASCTLMTDQRGQARPQNGDGDMNADCDIGAFEVEEPFVDLIFENGFESPPVN